jgi:hypothetical protein
MKTNGRDVSSFMSRNISGDDVVKECCYFELVCKAGNPSILFRFQYKAGPRRVQNMKTNCGKS